MNLIAAYNASLAAPDGDDEVHRHEHGFPEHEEQQEIETHEDAQHADLQEQKERVVFLQAVLNGGPARKDRQEAEQRGEHDEQQRETVDAQVVRSADGGNPIGALDELEVLGVIELKDERQRNQKSERMTPRWPRP